MDVHKEWKNLEQGHRQRTWALSPICRTIALLSVHKISLSTEWVGRNSPCQAASSIQRYWTWMKMEGVCLSKLHTVVFQKLLYVMYSHMFHFTVLCCSAFGCAIPHCCWKLLPHLQANRERLDSTLPRHVSQYWRHLAKGASVIPCHPIPMKIMSDWIWECLLEPLLHTMTVIFQYFIFQLWLQGSGSRTIIHCRHRYCITANCTEQSAFLKILKLLQLKACSSLLRVPERPFSTLPQVHRCQESLLKGSANIAGPNWAAEWMNSGWIIAGWMDGYGWWKSSLDRLLWNRGPSMTCIFIYDIYICIILHHWS